jgi:hypothetical protein
MNILKRLTNLPADELHGLQEAILNEIQRRQKAASGPLTPRVGQMHRRQDLADVAGNEPDRPATEVRKAVEGKRSGASKPVPVAARPSSPRRAA